MTIFDTLRYPISIPPQEGELDVLPEKLYRNWIDNHTVDWHTIAPTGRYDPVNVSLWMRLAFANAEDKNIKEIHEDIHALKRLISEYET